MFSLILEQADTQSITDFVDKQQRVNKSALNKQLERMLSVYIQNGSINKINLPSLSNTYKR